MKPAHMKIARWIVSGVAIVFVVLLVVAYLLLRHALVTRTIAVAAPPAAVFPLVGDLRRFNEWSPWADRDPATVYTFTGPTDGVGQTLNWSSKVPEVGAGSMKIDRLEPDKAVDVEIVFAGEGDAAATIALEPSTAGTTVTWTFDADLGLDPVGRYFGLMMDGQVGPDLEKGLARLKSVAEAKPVPG